jgi:Fe-S oxidoreductase
MKYSSFQEYLNAEEKRILEKCKACSKCIEVCTNVNAFNLSKEQTKSLPQQLLDALSDKELSDPVFQWVFGCNHCGLCLDICPKGIDPLERNYIIKTKFLNQGNKRVSMVRDRILDPVSGGFKKTIDIIHQLQMKPSEARWLTRIPDNPPDPVNVVLFLGCNGLIRPDLALSLIAILEMIGINYVALGGTDFCCGMPAQIVGEVEQSEKHMRNLIESLTALKPQTVLYACAECLYVTTRIAPNIMSIPFKQDSVIKFIADHMDRLRFKHPQPLKVTFHDSCGHGRLWGDYESPRKILKAIPGVELIEMKHVKQDAPCCGGTGEMFFPGKGEDLKKMRMEEAKETGAKELVTICVGCELSYLKWKGNKPFKITNIISLLAKSLGVEREHALEPFFFSKDMEGVLKKFKDNIKASKYSEDDYRMTLGRFIGVQSKGK